MTTAKFLLNWKVGLSQFQPNAWKTKTFVVAHQNVSFQWTAALMVRGHESATFNFRFSYSDGPLVCVENTSCTVSVVKPDGAVTRIGSLGGSSSQAKRGELYSSIILNTVTNHFHGDQIFFQIELQMLASSFTFSYIFPSIEPAQSWLRDLFGKIENPNNGYDFILVDSDGATQFYVHKLVLMGQSNALATRFCHPVTQEEHNFVYRFPTLTKESLKALLRYLYTGETEMSDLSMCQVILVALAAEQYGLKKFYRSCDASLWKRIVNEPKESVEVIRYANSGRLTGLRHRAMDVLAENLDNISFTSRQFGSRQLADEFAQYCARRVTVSSLANKWFGFFLGKS